MKLRDVNGCFIYRYQVRLNRYGDRRICNLGMVVEMVIPVHHRLPHPQIIHSLHQMQKLQLKQHAKTIYQRDDHNIFYDILVEYEVLCVFNIFFLLKAIQS